MSLITGLVQTTKSQIPIILSMVKLRFPYNEKEIKIHRLATSRTIFACSKWTLKANNKIKNSVTFNDNTSENNQNNFIRFFL